MKPVIAATLASILQNCNYHVLAFQDLKKAVSAAQGVVPDLLITDIVLSSDDGLELAEKIQQIHPECKIVVMSVRANAQELVSTRHLDIALLTKPTAPQELIAEVRRLIG